MKKCLRLLRMILILLLVVVAGYMVYLFTSYYRLEDKLPLDVEDSGGLPQTAVNQPYTLVSYNLGFGAYSADFSFFMDGGKESRARSAEAAAANIAGAADAVKSLEPDFILFQEVDVDSTRTYHQDQLELLKEQFPGFSTVYAQNYDSPYLFWPLLEPHGSSKSGCATFSTRQIDSALRRSLPVETGLSKFMDLDRCYSVSRLPVDGGGTLCLYNVHLSAYTTNGNTAVEQVKLLLSDMAAEYAAGNYVICGGDFNRDLLGNSGAIFGVSSEGQNWAQPFPTELLPEGIALLSSLDEAAPIPSCRNADAPYDASLSFVLTTDGFLVSANVETSDVRVIDTGFAWSDHQPVAMTFSLKSK